MRLRRIKGAEEAVAASSRCISSPEAFKENWRDVFKNGNPIHIEIGMGKGKFITTLARENPDINYIGIERYESVLLRALQKTDEESLSNLKFIRMDAMQIPDVFAQGEAERIYLNFSDPWPKDRHAKRRLTSRIFLERYDRILPPSGRIEFKTDNRGLFEFSLQELPKAGWNIDAFTWDLHHDASLNAGNIMTEYEEKFSSLGNPIYKLIASRGNKKAPSA